MTVIVTKRLRLMSGLNDIDRDLPTMVRWLNDPEVTHYSEQRHKIHDKESQHQYIIDGPDIFRKICSGDVLIGTLTAYIDKNNSVANVGILIGEKKEWGKGYGTEAWQAFCDYLLTHGIRKIEAGAMACNFGMIHIFRKTGMYYEGRLDGHFQFNNELVALVQWARFI